MKTDLSPLFDGNRIKCGVLRPGWFVKNNLQHLFSSIHDNTAFLDDYQPTLRERIFYIQNNLGKVQICPYCNSRKLRFFHNLIQLAQRCSSLECKKILTSIRSKENQKNMTDEAKIQKSRKISAALSGRGLADGHRENIRSRMLGTVQSEKTKRKRIKTRKENGRPWHEEDVKVRISETNKKTFGEEEHKKKMRAIFTDEYRKSHSTRMKNKILRGEFTPCITNSYTKWKSFVNIDNTLKKFRSNWECVFWLLNPELGYEIMRIPYEIDGEQKIYIVDFCDSKNKTLYEVKPDSEKDKKKNTLKMSAAKEWCGKNGWNYMVISDSWFVENAKKINYEEQPQLYKSMKQFL